MKLVEVLTQAGYDYNKGENLYKSPKTGRWLQGGEALYEFYGCHFPGLTRRIETKGVVFEDPFASVHIKDTGKKLELTRVKAAEQRNLLDNSDE